MIRITLYEHDAPWMTAVVDALLATTYAAYAQACGYGITMEIVGPT